VSPTWYFNVPKGYDALIPYLRADETLRKTFFKNLKVMWYAGAGMAQHVWDALDELAVMATGERVLVLTGLGATETAPFALASNQTMIGAGVVGTPARGAELKLVPVEEKFEARVRGPLITPGYWRQPDLTAKAFDDEGFYMLGDALRFVDRDNVNKGFLFDGRIAEDFKLDTGTWVAVGPLRASFIDHCAPLVHDVVLGGGDRSFIGALIFPDFAACCQIIGAGAQALPLEEIVAHPRVREAMTTLLASHAAKSTGSSTRIARAIILHEGPSIDKSEMTDKGSLNQRAVLAHRAHLVERLYARTPDEGVLLA
jgi:feruloyl-CoA synthase